MTTGSPGAGSGSSCAGMPAGAKVTEPTSVVVWAWKPLSSWNARDTESIPLTTALPSPDWAITSLAMVCRELEETTPSRLVVHTRVLTPETVPRPGTVTSASWFSRSMPARFVQPITR